MAKIPMVTEAAHLLCDEHNIAQEDRLFAYQANEDSEFTNVETDFVWASEVTMPFTHAELLAKAEWVVENEALHFYKQRRKAGYPPLQEQLDMQYWDSVNGTTTWADAIAAVKDANPKP